MDPKEANKVFVGVINFTAQVVHDCAVRHGFWDGPQNFGEKIALIHSELSEALEAHRSRKPDGFDLPDKHCPEYSNLEIELADAVIRIMDVACGFNLRLGEAIIAKAKFNEIRPVKHERNY